MRTSLRRGLACGGGLLHQSCPAQSQSTHTPSLLPINFPTAPLLPSATLASATSHLYGCSISGAMKASLSMLLTLMAHLQYPLLVLGELYWPISRFWLCSELCEQVQNYMYESSSMMKQLSFKYAISFLKILLFFIPFVVEPWFSLCWKDVTVFCGLSKHNKPFWEVIAITTCFLPMTYYLSEKSYVQTGAVVHKCS